MMEPFSGETLPFEVSHVQYLLRGYSQLRSLQFQRIPSYLRFLSHTSIKFFSWPLGSGEALCEPISQGVTSPPKQLSRSSKPGLGQRQRLARSWSHAIKFIEFCPNNTGQSFALTWVDHYPFHESILEMHWTGNNSTYRISVFDLHKVNPITKPFSSPFCFAEVFLFFLFPEHDFR